MKNFGSQKRDHAFNLLELFISVAVIAALVTIALRTSRHRATACRINCSNNLKQVGLAFRVWALDNNDRFPMRQPLALGGTEELVPTGTVWQHFQVMSNELSTPKILYCPQEDDRKRQQANSFGNPAAYPGGIPFTNNNQVSYFVGVDADDPYPSMLLCGDRNLSIDGVLAKPGLITVRTNNTLAWVPPRHDKAGYLGFADGSVRVFHTPALSLVLQDTGFPTNRLAMP